MRRLSPEAFDKLVAGGAGAAGYCARYPTALVPAYHDFLDGRERRVILAIRNGHLVLVPIERGAEGEEYEAPDGFAVSIADLEKVGLRPIHEVRPWMPIEWNPLRPNFTGRRVKRTRFMARIPTITAMLMAPAAEVRDGVREWAEFENLPADVTVAFVEMAPASLFPTVVVYLECAEFEPVEEGAEVPEYELQFVRRREVVGEPANTEEVDQDGNGHVSVGILSAAHAAGDGKHPMNCVRCEAEDVQRLKIADAKRDGEFWKERFEELAHALRDTDWRKTGFIAPYEEPKGEQCERDHLRIGLDGSHAEVERLRALNEKAAQWAQRFEDLAHALRVIIDPTDEGHFSPDGSLARVRTWSERLESIRGVVAKFDTGELDPECAMNTVAEILGIGPPVEAKEEPEERLQEAEGSAKPTIDAGISLERLAEVFSSDFVPPYLPEGMVTVRMNTRKNGEKSLTIRIGPRDIDLAPDGTHLGGGNLMTERWVKQECHPVAEEEDEENELPSVETCP